MSSIKEFFKNVAENEVSDFEKDLFIKEKRDLDTNLFNSLIKSAEEYLIDIKLSVTVRLGKEIPYVFRRNDLETVLEDVQIVEESILSYLNGAERKTENEKPNIDLEKEDIQKFYFIVTDVTLEKDRFKRFINNLKKHHSARIENSGVTEEVFPKEIFKNYASFKFFIDANNELKEYIKSDIRRISFIYYHFKNYLLVDRVDFKTWIENTLELEMQIEESFISLTNIKNAGAKGVIQKHLNVLKNT